MIINQEIDFFLPFIIPWQGSSDHCIGIPCLQAALVELEKATLPQNASDMCHHIFIYDGRDKNVNSQTNSSVRYIY